MDATKAKEKAIAKAVEKTSDLFKARPGSKEIEKAAKKLDFHKPETVADLVKAQGLNSTKTRNETTALYDRILDLWKRTGKS